MSPLRSAGPGDALVGLALVALVVAALLPSYRARAFQRSVEEAVTEVDALRAAALRLRAASGDWPSSRPPGAIPPGTAGSFGGDSTMTRDGYTLQWLLLERVEHVEAPPTFVASSMVDEDEAPVRITPSRSDAPPDSATSRVLVPVVRTDGAVLVHSGNDLLLAELLRHFGTQRSFVRDTTWTLVVPGP